MSTIDGFVPTKTFNWYQMPNQSILSRIKRFRGTKPEQIVVRISQHIRTTIRQSSPIHNRITDLSYTAMYTHPQTKRQRNGSTDMDTVPRKIGIRRVIPCRFPRLSLMRRPEQIQDHLHRIERIQRNLDKTRIPVTHRTIPQARKLESL